MTDWQTIASLGEDAAQRGLKPFHDSEWLPFIEAYVQLGRYDDAARLINLIQDGQLSTSKILICGFIDRMTNNNAESNPVRLEFLRTISQQSACSVSTQ
jgi:hypothetical protein